MEIERCINGLNSPISVAVNTGLLTCGGKVLQFNQDFTGRNMRFHGAERLSSAGAEGDPFNDGLGPSGEKERLAKCRLTVEVSGRPVTVCLAAWLAVNFATGGLHARAQERLQLRRQARDGQYAELGL